MVFLAASSLTHVFRGDLSETVRGSFADLPHNLWRERVWHEPPSFILSQLRIKGYGNLFGAVPVKTSYHFAWMFEKCCTLEVNRVSNKVGLSR